MAKRWTAEEDKMLLHYSGVGVDFIASHDLGRPDGAGSRRFKALTKSGARLHYARMMQSQILFDSAAGRPCFDPKLEMWLWVEEEETAKLEMDQ